MNYKKFFSFTAIGIISGLVIGLILRFLTTGTEDPSRLDGFIGLGELSEKIARVLLIIPTIIGGITGLIWYAISEARLKRADKLK